MEYGEKCIKLFFNLQYRNATKKNVLKLVTNDGVTHDSPDDVLKEEVKYFGNMFSFQTPPSPLTETNCMDFFPNINVKFISVQKDSREGQITEEELLEAIGAFKDGKTPGLDGIPVEVYNTFFGILKGPLMACFNHSYINGRLSDMKQEGLISLLLKQDPSGIYKDPVHLKNWRPLTLQCCDAKNHSKLLGT